MLVLCLVLLLRVGPLLGKLSKTGYCLYDKIWTAAASEARLRCARCYAATESLKTPGYLISMRMHHEQTQEF